MCKTYGKLPDEVCSSLTMPQVLLMLDGAAYNAPVLDEADDGRPPKPDAKTEPVAFLRWQLMHEFKRPPEEVETLCQRFEADIASGARVWDERTGNWVVPG